MERGRESLFEGEGNSFSLLPAHCKLSQTLTTCLCWLPQALANPHRLSSQDPTASPNFVKNEGEKRQVRSK